MNIKIIEKLYDDIIKSIEQKFIKLRLENKNLSGEVIYDLLYYDINNKSDFLLFDIYQKKLLKKYTKKQLEERMIKNINMEVNKYNEQNKRT